MQHPTGTVAFLFTDVEGSTRLWDERPAEMDVALAAHDELVRDAVDAESGLIFSTAGDGFAAAFGTASQGLRAAVAAQLALARHPWPDGARLSVRMGLHVGSATERGGDFFGPAVNRAARLMGLAGGGQVVVSQAMEQLTRGALPDGVSLVAVGAHQFRGLADPEHVFQVTGAGLGADHLRGPGADAAGDLPSPLTTFVGRLDDVREVARLVARRRLVSLVGPGGIGKTRLAIEVAHTLVGGRFEARWWCELAPVEAAGVAPTVASSVGALLRPGQDATTQIVDALSGRRGLLLLDNCEHVAAEVAHIVGRVMERAPEVCVLCTSREALHVAGEQRWLVQGLADAGVELFCERAADQRPDFVPRREELAAIESICRRLDGMPLAIELAAARVRSLSMADLADRLDERFRLLRGSVRGTPLRHQTLRDTVQWSYDLLAERERMLFERLSVFAGTFSLEAVELVCADDAGGSVGGIDRSAVIDVLESLVDRSMVSLRPSTLGTRYALLETLRQFAAERLAARSGGAEPWRLAHAHFHRHLARREGRRLLTNEEPMAWRALEDDWDNLRAAFDYGLGRGVGDIVAEIPAALGFFGVSALRAEVGDWAKAAIEGGLAVGHPAELDVRGAWAISAYWLAADFEGAGRALGPMVEVAPISEGLAYPLGAFLQRQATGDWPAAERVTRRWLDAVDGSVPTATLVFAAGARATYAAWSGDREIDRVGLTEQATAAATLTGSATLIGWAAWFRGLVLIRDDPARALRALDEAVAAVADLTELHFVDLGCRVWVNIAATMAGDLPRAFATLRDVLSLSTAHRTENVTINVLRNAALLLARLGHSATAARLLGAATATGHLGGGHRLVVDEAMACITSSMTPTEVAEWVEAGRALSLHAAVELTLDTLAAAEQGMGDRPAAEAPSAG